MKIKLSKLILKSVLFFSVVALVIFLSSSVLFTKINADTPGVALDGYAWSENIGWIDFHPSSGGITLDSSGNLTGYAWSENIGWIKFGGLSGFPSWPNTVASNAKVSGNNLVGWARVCSGMYDQILNQTTPNNTCTGNTRTDGFDGWINLSGGANYGVHLDSTTGYFVGYAWSSDVLGWIDFNPIIPIAVTPTSTPSASTPNFGVRISSTTTAAIPSPTGLIAGATNGCDVNLSWSSSASDVTFKIFRDNQIIVTEFPNKNYTDIVSDTNSHEYYVVASVDLIGDSFPSNSVAVSASQCSGPVINGTLTPGITSVCTASQAGNPVGDNNIYINKGMTWSVSLNDTGATELNTIWTGQALPSLGLTINKIHTTVGFKTINATTTGKNSVDGSNFTTHCSTTTLLKLYNVSNQEI